jgi:hypothetical protein
MSRNQIEKFNGYCLSHSLSPKYPNLQTLKLFSCGGIDDSGFVFGDHMIEEFLALFPSITSLYRVETKTKFITPPKFPTLKYITFSESVRQDQINWVSDEVETRLSSAQPVLSVRVSRYTYSLSEDTWSRLRDLVEVVQLDDDSNSLRYTGESDDEMGDDYSGEDPYGGYDDFSDWDAEDWENDYEDEIEEDAWNSDN